MHSTIRNSLVTVTSFLIMVLIWKFLSMLIGADIILPAPEVTARDLLNILQALDFWPIVGATVFRGLVGFLLSCLAGIAVGLAAGFSSLVYWLLQPYLTVIRTTPVMSIILLALIWFRTEMVPVFVAFLIAFPIICGNVIEGIRNVDRQLLEMARLYRVKGWRIVLELYLPSILPFIVAGASTAMAITWKVIVAAEILSQPPLGIGTQMQDARIYLNTARIFAWTAVIIGVSFLFESLMRAAENRLKAWR